MSKKRNNERQKEVVSLSKAYPDLVFEWDFERNQGLTPDDVTPGMKRKVCWKCKNNPDHRWEALISNRARVKNLVDVQYVLTLF